MLARKKIELCSGIDFETLEVGHVISSPHRIVTNQDIIDFARLTGDTNPIHTDPIAAAKTEFRLPIAHGALILSLATGLAYQLGIAKDTVVFTKIETAFKRPVYPGEYIYLEITVASITAVRRPVNSKEVVLRVQILKDSGRVVQECEWRALVTKRD